jgi:peptidoglycan/LPS O-acetylase OafA/YrhL
VYYAPFESLTKARDVITKICLTAFNGHAAVVVFFVLSGAVLARSLQRDQSPPTILCIDFVVRRLFRIMPAVIACMLFYFALGWLLYRFPIIQFPFFSLSDTVLNSLLIKITMHGPSLTVQTELLAVPFILIFFFIGRWFGMTGLFLCVLYTLLGLQHPYFMFNLPNVGANLLAFSVGMLVADERMKSLFQDSSQLAVVVLAAAVLLARQIVTAYSVVGVIIQIIAAGALIGAIMYGGAIRWLEAPTPQYLGRISYSLYLLNVPVLYLVWGVSYYFVTVPTKHALAIGLLVGAISLLITIPIASLSERYVERTGIRLANHLLRRTRAASPAAHELSSSETLPGEPTRV